MTDEPLATHFIRGQSVPTTGADPVALVCPANGASLGRLSPARSEAVSQAVGAASAAYAEWSALPVKERVQPLFRFRTLVEKNLGELAECVSRENGKLPAEAAAGIQRGLEVVEFACSLPNLIASELLEVSPGVDCFTRRNPLGVVVGITPVQFSGDGADVDVSDGDRLREYLRAQAQ